MQLNPKENTMASAIAVIDKRVGNSPTIAEAFAESAEGVFPGPSDDALVEDVRVDRRTATNLVFIDPRVADHQTLLAGLDADGECLLLDMDSDGVLQMAIALADRRDLASLRILAHGRPGALMLGAGELTRAAVDHHARELAVIGRALHAEGDVQIYGCEVGQGDAGRAFVDALAEALGAPVAASSAPVGHAGLGGGWQLDVGKLRTLPFALPDWHGLLGMTVTRLMPSFPGHGAGEWRNDRAFAALRADGSVVTWGNSSYGGSFGSLPMSLGNAASLANPDKNEVYSPTGVNHYYGSAGNDWLAGDVTDETLSGGAVGARYLAGVPDDSGSGGLRHGRWRAVRGTIRGAPGVDAQKLGIVRFSLPRRANP